MNYIYWVIAALGLAGLIILFSFSPVDHQFFPKCPFLSLSGLRCPGCGSTRALHFLLHLNIPMAMHYNLLLVLSLPYVFFGIYMEYFKGKLKWPALHNKFFGRFATFFWLVVVLLWWGYRLLVDFEWISSFGYS